MSKVGGEETISLVTVTRTRDDFDNYVDVYTVTDVEDCNFEPEQSTERTDPRSPGVTSPARIYAPASCPAVPPSAIIVRPPGATLDDDGHLVITGEAWAVQGNVERWPDVVISLTSWKSPV